jgi:hypothetical protein
MSACVSSLSLELDPLIAEAKQRARRRRFLHLTCPLVVAAAPTAVFTLRSPGKPTLPVTAAPACRADQLSLAWRSGGVAGGTAGDGFVFANTSRAVCTLSGWPRFRLVIGDGRQLTTRPHDLLASGYSVKHPPPVPRVHLAPGGTVQWTLEAADGTGLAHTCPTAQKLLVVPPGGHKAIPVAATVPFCGPRYFWTFPIGRLH